MKRINLSVDIEDNELFEKTFIEAVSAEARQIARDEFTKHMQAEISRIVKENVNELLSGEWSSVRKLLNESVKRELMKQIDSGLLSDSIIRSAFNNSVMRVENKANSSIEQIDSAMQAQIGLIDSKINEAVNNYIDKSFKKGMLDLIFNSAKDQTATEQ